jgi:hypothetical protein
MGPGSEDRLLPRRTAALLVLLLALQALLIGGVVRAAREVRPHGLPLAIVAPPVVGASLATEIDDLPGSPFVAAAADDEAAARRDLVAGRVRAMVVVDLATTADTLVLDTDADERLDRAVRRQVVAFEHSRGRTVTTQALPSDDRGPGHLALLALACGLVGFLLVAAIAWWRGPLARTLPLGLVRLASLSLLSAVAGVALALAAADGVASTTWQLAAVAALAVLAAGAVTLALAALAGYAGIGLAAVVFVAMATPLMVGTDLLLLPRRWQVMAAWTPPGACLKAFEAVTRYDGAGLARPMLVLGAWAALGVAVVALSRRERALGAQAQEAGRTRHWRLRIALVVVPAAALATVLVSVVGRTALSSAATPPQRASETACVGTGQVESVQDLNRIATTLRGGASFQGADVGADTVLQDGRRLWLFGDTLRAADFAGQRFVRNSMLVFGPDCIQSVVPADHGALIPDRPARGSAPSVGYWPMSVASVARPGYDLVAVMAQRVRATGAGAFDFENLGPAVAVFVVGRGQAPQLVTVRDIGPDDASPQSPAWGAASAVSDGWLYLYGTAQPRDAADGLVFGRSLHVARVRPERVLEPRAWRYWTGDGWSPRARDAVELVDAAGGTSQTLSVFEQSGRWYALSKRDDFLGRQVVVWSAPDPWGPFDAGRPVADLPSDAASGELRYMPLAHPDLLPRPGQVVVSYSRNRTDLGEVIDDPKLYRPHFLRVRLPR